MPKTKVKKPKVPEPFWRECVGTYLKFSKEKLNPSASFISKHARPLKSIIGFLRNKYEIKYNLWTKDISCVLLYNFLSVALDEPNSINSFEWFIIQVDKYKSEIFQNIKED